MDTKSFLTRVQFENIGILLTSSKLLNSKHATASRHFQTHPNVFNPSFFHFTKKRRLNNSAPSTLAVNVFYSTILTKLNIFRTQYIFQRNLICVVTLRNCCESFQLEIAKLSSSRVATRSKINEIKGETLEKGRRGWQLMWNLKHTQKELRKLNFSIIIITARTRSFKSLKPHHTFIRTVHIRFFHIIRFLYCFAATYQRRRRRRKWFGALGKLFLMNSLCEIGFHAFSSRLRETERCLCVQLSVFHLFLALRTAKALEHFSGSTCEDPNRRWKNLMFVCRSGMKLESSTPGCTVGG